MIWTSRASEVGTFCSLVNVSPSILIHEGYLFSVDHWIKACTVVRSGNFRVSSRTGLLFGLNQIIWSEPELSLFMEPTILGFPI